MDMEHKEQFETTKPQVWIIDDNDDLNQSILRSGSTNGNVQFNSFNNGEAALAKLEELIKNKQEIPWQILLDY